MKKNKASPIGITRVKDMNIQRKQSYSKNTNI